MDTEGTSRWRQLIIDTTNTLQPITAAQLLVRAHYRWSSQWMLLTAGDFAAGTFIYWQDMQPSNCLDPGIATSYPKLDYHRIYFGEIVAVAGTEAFWRRRSDDYG